MDRLWCLGGVRVLRRGVIYLYRESSSDVAYSPTQFSVVCFLVGWLLIRGPETSNTLQQKAFQSCHQLNSKHIFNTVLTCRTYAVTHFIKLLAWTLIFRRGCVTLREIGGGIHQFSLGWTARKFTLDSGWAMQIHICVTFFFFLFLGKRNPSGSNVWCNVHMVQTRRFFLND